MAGAVQALDRLAAGEGKRAGAGRGDNGVLRQCAAISGERGAGGDVDDIAGRDGAAAGDFQGAVRDGRGAGVGVLPGEGDGADGGLGEPDGARKVGGGGATADIKVGQGGQNPLGSGAGAGDGTGLERDAIDRVGVGAEREFAAVYHYIGGIIEGVGGITKDQGAGVDEGVAGVGVLRVEGDGSARGLGQIDRCAGEDGVHGAALDGEAGASQGGRADGVGINGAANEGDARYSLGEGVEMERAINGDVGGVGDLLAGTGVDRAVVGDIDGDGLGESGGGGGSEGEGAGIDIHIAGEGSVGEGGGAAVDVDDAGVAGGGMADGAVEGDGAVGGDDAIAEVGVDDGTVVQGVGGGDEGVTHAIAIDRAAIDQGCHRLVVGGGVGVGAIQVHHTCVREGGGVGDGFTGSEIQDGGKRRGDVSLNLDRGDVVEATIGAKRKGACVHDDVTQDAGVIGVEDDFAGFGLLAIEGGARINDRVDGQGAGAIGGNREIKREGITVVELVTKRVAGVEGFRGVDEASRSNEGDGVARNIGVVEAGYSTDRDARNLYGSDDLDGLIRTGEVGDVAIGPSGATGPVGSGGDIPVTDGGGAVPKLGGSRYRQRAKHCTCGQGDCA